MVFWKGIRKIEEQKALKFIQKSIFIKYTYL